MADFNCPNERESECKLFGVNGKCNYCDGKMYFSPKKIKQKPTLRTQKKSHRMGAKFEEENHEKNVRLFGRESCFQTPNSGAGDVYKSDEWINACVTALQELKTNIVPKIARGVHTYTVKRNELEKCIKEGKNAGLEFFYLKFRFLESDSDTYSIISDELIDAILVTINEDRKKVKRSQAEINLYKTKYEHITAKNLELETRIKELEAEIEFSKYQDHVIE